MENAVTAEQTLKEIDEILKNSKLRLKRFTQEAESPKQEKFAEIWYTYFKQENETYRYLRVKIEDMEICFPAEKRPTLKLISEKALERINNESWNQRTVSQPLPTTWMKTGL